MAAAHVVADLDLVANVRHKRSRLDHLTKSRHVRYPRACSRGNPLSNVNCCTKILKHTSAMKWFQVNRTITHKYELAYKLFDSFASQADISRAIGKGAVKGCHPQGGEVAG